MLYNRRLRLTRPKDGHRAIGLRTFSPHTWQRIRRVNGSTLYIISNGLTRSGIAEPMYLLVASPG
jgi:hypothetical protein